MNQLEPTLVPLRQVDRLQSEDPADLVRKSDVPGAEVAFPPTNVRDALRLFQSDVALA